MSARPLRGDPVPPAHPWLMPAIVTVAVLVVVGGAVWAALLGHLL